MNYAHNSAEGFCKVQAAWYFPPLPQQGKSKSVLDFTCDGWMEFNNMKLNLLLAMVALMTVIGVSGAQAKSRSAKLAHTMWHNSGRYAVPSYPQNNLYLTAYRTQGQRRVIEGRTNAFIPQGYFTTGREQMVMALGA